MLLAERVEGTGRDLMEYLVQNPDQCFALLPLAMPISEMRRVPASTMRGKFAFVKRSSDDFAREKQLEIEREDRYPR